MLGVDRNWLYRRIVCGALPAQRDPLHGYYLVPDDPALLENLRAQVPTWRRRPPKTVGPERG